MNSTLSTPDSNRRVTTDLRKNAVETEVIRNALIAAAEEMSMTVWRTSRSSVVREILDYSTCVFDAHGNSVAQAARMPVHLNSMPTCLTQVLRDYLPLEAWNDGDVVMTNDPYCGGQHLSDVLTFRPVFFDGERIAIAGILVHHLDVGGGAPGSYYANATEIFQEGVRIPPVHVVRAGVRNEDVIRIFLRNSREPISVGGDFNSQLAALEVGAAKIAQIAGRYSSARLAAASQRIQAQSEFAMRGAIAGVPDGVYQFEDHVDDDGITPEHIAVRVQLRVAGETLEVDLGDSDPQAAGPVNCTLNMTSSAVICGVMMAIGREIPANAGCYRPIQVIASPGSCTNATEPAPVANRMAVGHRIVNTVLGAFSQALPREIPAAYYGVSYAYAMNARNEDGTRQVYFDLECGGWGAHPTSDGANGFSCGFHNIANSPVEMIEVSYPVTFMEYSLRADSGGAGRRRGGLGLVREFRLEAPTATFAANFDRFRVPPYGLAGGEPGARGRLTLLRSPASDRVDETAGVQESLPSKVAGITLIRGDRIRVETSGGGGHGVASQRDNDMVNADLEQGYISSTAASDHYGVLVS